MDYLTLVSGSDVRGAALGEHALLTPEVGRRIGQAFCQYLHTLGLECPRINVGRDPRLSGEALEAAIAEGMQSAGAQVTVFGLCTTPAMYMSLITGKGGHAAVMVTASHLPWERNGYKFFLPDGGITSSVLKKILALANSDEDFSRAGGTLSTDQYLPIYTELLRNVMCERCQSGDRPLTGLHVIVDAGNGAGGFYAELLGSLGANTEGSQFLEPDGHFPNHIPNPENEAAMDSISQAVLRSHADLGVIFDTDCDRAAIVDSEGREINRNRLIALISAVLLREQPGATIVTDSVTSSGLAEFIRAHGGVHHRFKRGYRNVIDEAARLRELGQNAPLAIETSGHAALQENHNLDDGMYLVTRLLCEAVRLQKEGKSLSSLIADLREPAESREIRLTLTDADFKPAGQRAIDLVTAVANENPDWHVAPDNHEGIRVSFDIQSPDSTWFLLRLSLHDPVLPINFESDVKGGIAPVARKLYDVLKTCDGIDFSAFDALLNA